VNDEWSIDMNMHETTTFKTAADARARRVTYRTRGRSHGSITRLVSPSDVGELIKPFVFLDYFEMDPNRTPALGFHPHSGIATLTLLLEGQVSYEETSGTKGVIEPGGVEWMRAAGGVWHTGGVVGTARAKGYQLWVALPPEMESIESAAQYLGGEHFQSHGPARVILGRHGDAMSKVAAPKTINYLDVALKKGEKWRYEPPANHTVAWVAVHKGKLATPEIVERGELAVFEESNSALEFEALDDTGFVLGAAVKHPHDLVLGMYSVHTNTHALARGEAKIAEIGRRLRAEGRV
jgi:redox-sensitive bicupin YhaK (pirin superfamily)